MAGDLKRADPSGAPAHVLIAGGGFAAAEALLALYALASESVRVTLVSTSPTLAYKPAATREAFDETGPLVYDLEELAADLGASFRLDRFEAVAPEHHRVRLASFAHIEYDVLVLALGARASSELPGAFVFRDQREVGQIRGIVSALRTGELRRLVFVVPSGRCWPFPLYELALGAAAQLREERTTGEVLLISPESVPLQIFGTRPSRLVAKVLAECGVRFIGDADAARVTRGRTLTLTLRSGEPIDADRVVTVPRLLGRRITGVPTDREGFVTTDAFGRVLGLRDVFAAGDMTSFPIKQGGLATQQADVIAQQITAEHGSRIIETRIKHVLQAELIGGAEPVMLRTELDQFGRPTDATPQHARPTGHLPSSQKVFGRYLTPYLHRSQSVAVTKR